MQTFLKPFKKLAGRVLLGLKPLALRARGFKPGRLYIGRWNALMSRWSMCDAEKDWHERAFRQKLRQGAWFFLLLYFRCFFINYEILEDVFAL
jgi:hypothetical protein